MVSRQVQCPPGQRGAKSFQIWNLSASLSPFEKNNNKKNVDKTQMLDIGHTLSHSGSGFSLFFGESSEREPPSTLLWGAPVTVVGAKLSENSVRVTGHRGSQRGRGLQASTSANGTALLFLILLHLFSCTPETNIF
jgi:hypothetical protein